MPRNVEDGTPPLKMNIIYATKNNWIDYVQILINKCSTIVLYLSDITEGVKKEIEIINTEKLENKTIIFSGNQDVTSLLYSKGFSKISQINRKSMSTIVYIKDTINSLLDTKYK